MKYNYDIIDFVNCHTMMADAQDQAEKQRRIKARKEEEFIQKIKSKSRREKIEVAIKIAMVTFIVFAVGVLCGVCLVPVV